MLLTSLRGSSAIIATGRLSRGCAMDVLQWLRTASVPGFRIIFCVSLSRRGVLHATKFRQSNAPAPRAPTDCASEHCRADKDQSVAARRDGARRHLALAVRNFS